MSTPGFPPGRGGRGTRFPFPNAGGLGQAPEAADSGLRNLLRDLARLDPNSAYGTSIRLQVSISSTTTSDTDDVDTAGDFDLAVHKVTGIFSFDNLPAEPFVIANYNVSPLERAFVKAQNCKVLLENTEDKLDILDEDLILASILPPFGEPIVFPIPHIIPRGRRVRGTFTLIDTCEN